MTTLNTDIKTMIIDVLQLEDIAPEDIVDSEPLFVEGLGLDSIDALELGVAIKKKYNILINADATDTQHNFASIDNLVAFIEKNRS
jgi:acyl carrier protein